MVTAEKSEEIIKQYHDNLLYRQSELEEKILEYESLLAEVKKKIKDSE